MKLIKILLIVAVTLGAASCKTNEKNYREAYEKVIEKKKSAEDPELDGLIKGDYYDSGRTMSFTLDGDTLKTRVIVVNKTEIEGLTSPELQRFCVVAAEFKQIYNAKTLVARLRDMGYDAFVVNDSRPEYFVIASTTDMAVAALEELRALAADKRVAFQPRCPWVLQVARLVR